MYNRERRRCCQADVAFRGVANEPIGLSAVRSSSSTLSFEAGRWLDVARGFGPPGEVLVIELTDFANDPVRHRIRRSADAARALVGRLRGSAQAVAEAPTLPKMPSNARRRPRATARSATASKLSYVWGADNLASACPRVEAGTLPAGLRVRRRLRWQDFVTHPAAGSLLHWQADGGQ